MKPQQFWIWKHPADRIIDRCNSKRTEEKAVESFGINIGLKQYHESK